MLGTELAKHREKTRARQHQTHVTGIRLDDDAGDLRALARKRVAHRFAIVIRQHDRVADRAGGDAGRVGLTERQASAAGRNEKRVTVAVVAAGKLYDFISSGCAASEA